MIGVIVLLGIGLVAFAANDRKSEADVAPVAQRPLARRDRLLHLRRVRSPTSPSSRAAIGIHTHGDGVIHIHPSSDGGAGENATLGAFLEGAGIELTDDELTIGDETWKEGEDECGGEDAELVVAQWKDVQSTDEKPALIRRDFDDDPLPRGRRGLHHRLRARGHDRHPEARVGGPARRRWAPPTATATATTPAPAAGATDTTRARRHHDGADHRTGHHRPGRADVRAVVLVGGFGTRLRPLTCDRPKQMLPIVAPADDRARGRPPRRPRHRRRRALARVPARTRSRAGYPDGSCAGARLHYAVEPEPLDTAGAIRFAAHARRHRRPVPRAQRRRAHRPRHHALRRVPRRPRGRGHHRPAQGRRPVPLRRRAVRRRRPGARVRREAGARRGARPT